MSDSQTKYRQVLYQPDRVLLHKELNETQEIVQTQIKEISNAVFNNGAIIKGFSTTISDKKIEIEDGEVYIDGMIEKVKGKIFDLSENIKNIDVYLELTEKIIKSSDQESLRDPVTGQVAADRKIIKTKLTLDKKSHSENKNLKLFVINTESNKITPSVLKKTPLKLDDFDGNIHASRIKSSTISHHDTPKGGNSLFEVIAQRTADQCSSFVVKGLDTICGSNSESSVEVITGAGKAYIDGYRLELIEPKTFTIEKSTEKKAVLGEPHQTKKEVKQYKLHKGPVAKILKITGVKEIDEIVTLTRSPKNQGLFELELTNTPIYKIDHIEVIKNKEKIAPNLWKINGDKILITDEITSKKYFGESLKIKYLFNCLLKEKEDFILKEDSKNLEFLNPLVEDTIFTVDYEYFVGRKDTIYALPYGIKIINGRISETSSLPEIQSSSLKLCEIICPPNSTDVTLKNISLKAVSMETINNMLKDIEYLKRNAALQKINTAFSDQTLGKARALTYYFSKDQGDIDISHIDWNANFDSKQKIITLPEKKEFIPLTYDADSNNYSVFKTNNILCIGGKETVLLGENYKDSADKIEKIKQWTLSDQIKPTFTITPEIIVSKKNIIKLEGYNFGIEKNLNITCSCGKVVLLQKEPIKSKKDGTFEAKVRINLNPKLSTGDHTLTISNNLIKKSVKLTIQKDHRNIKANKNKLFPSHSNTSNKRECFAQILTCNNSCAILAVRTILSSVSQTLTLQIRGVENNKPNNIVYREKSIFLKETDGKAIVDFVFNIPFYAQKNKLYSIALLAHSKGKVTISTTKIEKLKTDNSNLLLKPSVLLKKQGNWENHPEHEALSIKILGYATYEKALVNFKPINIENNFNQMLLHSASNCDEGTDIKWSYNISEETSPDVQISADLIVNSPKIKNKQINFKALMQRSLVGQTPWIDSDNISLELYGYENKGTFITKMRMPVTDNVKMTTLYVNSKIPRGTSITWNTSCDDGKTWLEMKKNQEDRAVGNNITESSYSAKFDNQTQSNKMRFKAELLSDSTATTPQIHGIGATLS